MLNVFRLSAVMLKLVKLKVVMLSVIKLNVVMLNILTLIVVMPSIVVLRVVMLSVIQLDVVVLRVMAPKELRRRIPKLFSQLEDDSTREKAPILWFNMASLLKDFLCKVFCCLL